MRKQPQNRIRIPKTNPRSRSLPLKNQHEAFHANQGRHISRETPRARPDRVKLGDQKRSGLRFAGKRRGNPKKFNEREACGFPVRRRRFFAGEMSGFPAREQGFPEPAREKREKERERELRKPKKRQERIIESFILQNINALMWGKTIFIFFLML